MSKNIVAHLVVLCMLCVTSLAEIDGAEVVTLGSCLNYADEHNLDLRKSRLEKERITWAVLAARSKYAFNVGASTRYDIEGDKASYSVGLDKNFPMDFDLSATVTKSESGNQGTASIRLSKVILGGGTLEASNQLIEDALINETVAMNNIELSRQQLHVTIIGAYYRVIRGKQTLAIQQRQLKRSQDNKERAVERDRLLDIATSDIQVIESEERVIRAERELFIAHDALKRAMGMPVEESLALGSDFTFGLKDFDEDADWLFAQENHIDFLNFQLSLKKIERDLRIKHTELLPTVSLDYSLNQESEDEYDFSGDLDNSVGISVSWGVGNMADKSSYHRALIRQKVADIDYIDLYQRKILELRKLSRDRRDLVKSLGIAEKRLAFQERSTALYSDRWQNGEIDILEFIRNQDALENTRIDLLRQKILYIEKVAEYNLSVGRTGE